MLERLANILYWAGCAISALLGIIGILVVFDHGEFGMLLFSWVAGGLAWLAGKGLRYFLTGRTDNRLSGTPPQG